jgi:hypothetical protein
MEYSMLTPQTRSVLGILMGRGGFLKDASEKNNIVGPLDCILGRLRLSAIAQRAVVTRRQSSTGLYVSKTLIW